MNLGVVASLMALVVAACTNLPDTASRDGLPDEIKPNANETLAMIAYAKGVQIYQCRASNDRRDNYAWAFVAPEAELFDASGKQIGRHYAGPSWEAADGSKIVGALKAGIDAPQGDAIPWLLLSARSVGPRGSLSEVTAIQRVNTVGGAAPHTGCTQADAGAIMRMPYTADYRFLTGNGAFSASRFKPRETSGAKAPLTY
jgi:hypothetical protein